MFGFTKPTLLVGTIKAALAITALTVVAAQWLASQPLDRTALLRLVSDTSRLDPATTGSIGRAANATKLDPCAAPARKP